RIERYPPGEIGDQGTRPVRSEHRLVDWIAHRSLLETSKDVIAADHVGPARAHFHQSAKGAARVRGVGNRATAVARANDHGGGSGQEVDRAARALGKRSEVERSFLLDAELDHDVVHGLAVLIVRL